MTTNGEFVGVLILLVIFAFCVVPTMFGLKSRQNV
jgi:hypothetical protein